LEEAKVCISFEVEQERHNMADHEPLVRALILELLENKRETKIRNAKNVLGHAQ